MWQGSREAEQAEPGDDGFTERDEPEANQPWRCSLRSAGRGRDDDNDSDVKYEQQNPKETLQKYMILNKARNELDGQICTQFDTFNMTGEEAGRHGWSDRRP